MTRFWVTLTQGVNFVLSSLAMMRGGEIFVPKIPSMKVVDLATAMAPKLEQRIIGIRPGEKIHETLITDDDARSTIELDDRFVIEPSFAFWSRDTQAYNRGAPVPESFRYTSDANGEWLGIEDLRRLIDDESGE
jgi:UDP-N-acetylglucosamine 4,6-dehydratase